MDHGRLMIAISRLGLAVLWSRECLQSGGCNLDQWLWAMLLTIGQDGALAGIDMSG